MSFIPTLVLVAAIAVAAPMLAELTIRIGIPAVVLEIVLGIVFGPAVLNLAHPSTVVDSFADFGLGFLMFLAGYELDLMRVRGRPLRLAGEGWLLSVVLALVGAFALVSTGFALDSVVVGLALTTTALGTLLPIVRDAGLVDTPFGRHLMAVGTVGEFGPIVAVALLLTRKDPRLTALLLVAFLAVAVAAALLAARPQPPGWSISSRGTSTPALSCRCGCPSCSSCCWCTWPPCSVSTPCSGPSRRVSSSVCSPGGRTETWCASSSRRSGSAFWCRPSSW